VIAGDDTVVEFTPSVPSRYASSAGDVACEWQRAAVTGENRLINNVVYII
jgi:hypothetical protein